MVEATVRGCAFFCTTHDAYWSLSTRQHARVAHVVVARRAISIYLKNKGKHAKITTGDHGGGGEPASKALSAPV